MQLNTRHAWTGSAVLIWTTHCFSYVAAGTADRIVQEGFDMRLNFVAAYGNGLYFAGEITATSSCRWSAPLGRQGSCMPVARHCEFIGKGY